MTRSWSWIGLALLTVALGACGTGDRREAAVAAVAAAELELTECRFEAFDRMLAGLPPQVDPGVGSGAIDRKEWQCDTWL